MAVANPVFVWEARVICLGIIYHGLVKTFVDNCIEW